MECNRMWTFETVYDLHFIHHLVHHILVHALDGNILYVLLLSSLEYL